MIMMSVTNKLRIPVLFLTEDLVETSKNTLLGDGTDEPTLEISVSSQPELQKLHVRE